MSRQRRLEQTVAILRQRYGASILRRASELGRQPPPRGIPTGFPELDACTGCGGIPPAGLTLLRGRTTSGKLTLAYKVLVNAQQTRPAALVDLNQSNDPDYLVRCGVDLRRLICARSLTGQEAVNLIIDLAASRQVGVILLDSLPDLAAQRSALRYFDNNLARLQRTLRESGAAVLVMDEPQPPWLRWLGWQRGFALEQWAALWIELQREQWLYRRGELAGYRARARIARSRWAPAGRTASIAIRFNGVVRAARTW